MDVVAATVVGRGAVRREEEARRLCPKVGEILGERYRVEGILGVGGMGAVLSATQLDLDRRVAIKVLVGNAATDRESVARLAREGRALARLTTSHVSRLLDVGSIPSTGTPFLVMEYLEGQDLARALRSHGAFSVEKTVLLALDACEALDEAHAEGIVHRDIKPSNMFLCTTSGGCTELKILDFGISKVREGRPNEDGPSLTRTSQLLGSPLYMSPEQLRATRDVDARTDVWSLGVVLYELLSGRPPFDGETVADVCARILVSAPPPLKDVPAALAAVVMKCLEKDPERRFENVADLARSLVPFVTEKKHTEVMQQQQEEEPCGGLVLAPPLLSWARVLASAITIVAIGFGVWGLLRKPAPNASQHVTAVTRPLPSLSATLDDIPPPPLLEAEAAGVPIDPLAAAPPPVSAPRVAGLHTSRPAQKGSAKASNLALAEPDIGY